MRIVSLLPSATEIVCAIGEERSLVGRSSECDFPSTVTALPAVMRPKVEDFDRPSAVIDERVQRVRARSESLYYLDLERLRDLRPELLLTQDLCSVCSVTESEAAAACASAGVSPRVLSLSPRTLAEVWQSITTIGEALGRSREASNCLESVKLRAMQGTQPRSAVRPRVAIVEWLDPPILAGLWVQEMVEAAGGVSVGPPEGKVGDRTTWEEIGQKDADLVVLSPCSFSVARTRRELRGVEALEKRKPSSPRLGFWIADEAFFSRPGPRLSEGIALIRGLLNGTVPKAAMPFEAWDPREFAR